MRRSRHLRVRLHAAQRGHQGAFDALQQSARFPNAKEIIKLDGLRVEYTDGFGLMRASNTTPVIVLRFEGDSQAAIERIQAEFRAVLAAAKPGAQLPF